MFRLDLWCAIALPIAYFGLQLAFGLVREDYDWRSQPASALGAIGAPNADIVNLGVISVGCLALAAGAAHYAALRDARVAFSARVAAAAGLGAFGLSSIAAGLHPLPDPRHGAWGSLALLLLAYGPVMLLATRRRSSFSTFRVVTILCLCKLLLITPVMAGVWPGVAANDRGVLQRAVALALLLPPAFGAAAFLISSEKGSMARRSRRRVP